MRFSAVVRLALSWFIFKISLAVVMIGMECVYVLCRSVFVILTMLSSKHFYRKFKGFFRVIHWAMNCFNCQRLRPLIFSAFLRMADHYVPQFYHQNSSDPWKKTKNLRKSKNLIVFWKKQYWGKSSLKSNYFVVIIIFTRFF